MTIKSDLQAKLAEIDAKWTAERAPIQAELDAGGVWLEKEWHEFEVWATGLLAKNPTQPTSVQAAMQNPPGRLAP